MKYALFALLLFASCVFAIDSPKTQEIDVRIDFTRTLTAEREISSATFTSYEFPVAQVTVLSPVEYVKGIDAYGNTYLVREWESTNDLSYSLSLRVKNKAAVNSISVPPAFPYAPEDYPEYLAATKYAPITPEIAQKAREITDGSENAFDAVSRIAYWINQNIEYTLSYGSIIEPADAVLRDRKGTCDEFSHLFIAMVRSLGIPARYVSGITYGIFGVDSGGEADWYNHGWAEVYFGEWVPFDPTYGEYGYVDATHIKFAHGPDQEKFLSVLSWKPRTFEPDLKPLAYTIEILDSSEFAQPVQKIILSPKESRISPASSVKLGAELSSQSCIASELNIVYEDKDPSTPNLKLTLGKPSALIWTCSGAKDVSYTLQPPEGLDEGYIYSFETVVHNIAEEKKAKIDVDPTMSSGGSVRGGASPASIISGIIESIKRLFSSLF
ncbi:MAG: transglutaminase-like domain-containing protein [archaeon]